MLFGAVHVEDTKLIKLFLIRLSFLPTLGYDEGEILGYLQMVYPIALPPCNPETQVTNAGE